MRTIYFGQDKWLTKSEEKILSQWLRAPVKEYSSIGEDQASIMDSRCGNNRYHYVVVTIPKSKWASALTWGEIILATVRDTMSQTSGHTSLSCVYFDDSWMQIAFTAENAFGGLDPYAYEDQPEWVIGRMVANVTNA